MAQHAAVDANVLDRQFTLARPNQVWVSDFTYIRTDEGRLYLAIMLDLFSRQIVGWQMSNRIERCLLRMRCKQRSSTEGNQYCAKTFRQMIAQNKLTQSMGRKGNCWDNAVAESLLRA